MTTKKPTERQITLAISATINECRNGATGNGHVALGMIPGLPNKTTNPKDVEAAIKYLTHKANKQTSTIAELRTRQRILNLRAELDYLNTAPEANTNREVFIAHAAQWATEQGISYEAFREMGLPASLLKQAGIKRGAQ